MENSKPQKLKILAGILIMTVLLIGVGAVMAHENFNETKQLIDSNISCDNLNNEQLNEMGDYYMEQMHPGESHELMHEMMGGEDSEIIKLMHTNMAKSIYCRENAGMGMMDMMMGRGGMMNSGNMMSGGMMQGMMGGNMIGSGMAGNWGYYRYWNFLNVLYVTLIIGLIVLVYLWIIKLLRNAKK